VGDQRRTWKGLSVRPARPFAAARLGQAGGFTHPKVVVRAHPCRDRLTGVHPVIGTTASARSNWRNLAGFAREGRDGARHHSEFFRRPWCCSSRPPPPPPASNDFAELTEPAPQPQRPTPPAGNLPQDRRIDREIGKSLSMPQVEEQRNAGGCRGGQPRKSACACNSIRCRAGGPPGVMGSAAAVAKLTWLRQNDLIAPPTCRGCLLPVRRGGASSTAWCMASERLL